MKKLLSSNSFFRIQSFRSILRWAVLLLPAFSVISYGEILVNWEGAGNDDYAAGGYDGEVVDSGSSFYYRELVFGMSTPMNPGAVDLEPSERFYGGIDHRLDGEISLNGLNRMRVSRSIYYHKPKGKLSSEVELLMQTDNLI